MAEILYDFWMGLIDFFFEIPLSLSLSIRGVFEAGLFSPGSAFVNTAGTVAAFLAFWTDGDLFPVYFGVAVAWYFFCYLVSLAGRLITRVWDLLPFI